MHRHTPKQTSRPPWLRQSRARGQGTDAGMRERGHGGHCQCGVSCLRAVGGGGGLAPGGRGEELAAVGGRPPAAAAGSRSRCSDCFHSASTGRPALLGEAASGLNARRDRRGRAFCSLPRSQRAASQSAPASRQTVPGRTTARVHVRSFFS